MSRRAGGIGTLRRSQVATVIASCRSACGAVHGRVTSTRAAIRSRRAIVIATAAWTCGPAGGSAPLKRRRRVPSTNNPSPVLDAANVADPYSRASALNFSWPGPIHCPPRSTAHPVSVRSVKTLPPTRSRASSTATCSPFRCRARAAHRPAYPAPTITTSTCSMVTSMCNLCCKTSVAWTAGFVQGSVERSVARTRRTDAPPC